jgi:hypothetical protein
MKRYRIYTHPTGMTEAVKQGWSWPAFLFNAIWAMVKRIWGLGLGLVGAFFVLGLLDGLSGTDALAGNALIKLLGFVISIMFGVKGNAWREDNLLLRGFKLVGTVNAASPQKAVALHMAPQA